MGTLIAEDGTVDSLLSAAINEFSPNKEGISFPSSKDNLFAGAAEQLDGSPVFVSSAAIMSLVKFLADFVPILCYPPKRRHAAFLNDFTRSPMRFRRHRSSHLSCTDSRREITSSPQQADPSYSWTWQDGRPQQKSSICSTHLTGSVGSPQPRQ